VQVSPSELAFSAFGDTARLSAAAGDGNGNVIAGASVIWASANASVATIDATGLVTAVDNGSAAITATAGPVSGSATVNVAQIPVSAEVSPRELFFVAFGDTARLSAAVRDANGNVIAGASVTWASADASVATVDANGLVTSVGNGMTKVAATSVSASSVSAWADIRVEARSAGADREALVALYEAAGGDNWINNANWLSGKPLGDWHGVHTGRQGRVIGLGLWSNGLSGSIPPEIGKLTALEDLNLLDNGLSGPIPAELGNLGRLAGLELGLNDLSGPIPPELGGIPSLHSLGLSDNRLSGPLPLELANLANLGKLELSYNSLSGPIPPWVGGLADLTQLGLGANDLSGPVPPNLGGLAKLTALNLSQNAFSGPIPAEFGNLANLRHLSLIDAGLSGIIPTSLLNLPLRRFYWGNTVSRDLCMPDTPAFAAWVGAMDDHSGSLWCNESDRAVLEALYRTAGGHGWTNSGGWLGPAVGAWHGIRADSLGRVTALNLSRNGLAGELPLDLGDLALLAQLGLGGNPELSGRLPYTLPRLSELEEFRYPATGLCVPAESFIRDWLGGLREHEGTGVDCEPSSDREVLEGFHDAMYGTRWLKADNWLTDAPLRDWHGVEADGQGRVTGLRLDGNRLLGAIPPDLVGLSELVELNLSGNDLSLGPIPPELGRLANLEILILQGSLLPGSIPPELGGLARLENLRLSHNKLSGPIPDELGGLARLTHLDLSGNALSGSIPARFGELARLTQIHLERNRLSGSLPASLGGLRELTVLDLSSNALSGPIPAAVGDWASIKYLNLAYNELSGPVPRRRRVGS